MEYFYLTLGLFLVLSSMKASAMMCYICSHSPKDNRTDKCTDHNFQYNNVYVDDCKLGCETVVQYDANDEMEQWRRNCLQTEQKLLNVCHTEKTPGWRIVRCTCNRELCNTASEIIPSSFIMKCLIIVLWMLLIKR
nr:uncharacterized protein LOC107456679 [Parasteatoda tepidariorum]